MRSAASGKPLGRNVFEAILARRSVRTYTAERPDSGVVNTLLEAAVRAPTAIHGEPWAFLIIQDRKTLERLSDLAKPLFAKAVSDLDSRGDSHSFEHFDESGFDIFHGANTLIVICARTTSPFSSADCWLAAENLMLAACEMGLGSCVIGSSVEVLNTRKVKQELGIPDDYAAVAPMIVGMPGAETAAKTRKPPQILAWKQ